MSIAHIKCHYCTNKTLQSLKNVPSCGSALNVYKESDNRAMWNKLRTNHNIDVPET